jgi:hypothetical protein
LIFRVRGRQPFATPAMPAQLMNCTMTDQTDIEDKREIDELKRRVAQLEAKIRAALKILEGDLTLTATRN